MHMKKRKEKNKRHLLMERIPLWTQLFVIITVLFSMLVGFILVRDYNKNRQSIIEQKVYTSKRLMELEMQNLEQYVKDLTSFCIQPRYDTNFMTAIMSTEPLTVEQQEVIRRQMQIYYYTRADLNSYEVYLCHQDQTYGRLKNMQHIAEILSTDIQETEGYEKCFHGAFYNAIMPADSKDGFFDYYQAIIRIQDQNPEAVVRVEVDCSFVDHLNEEHQNSGEVLCILNEQGQMLFAGEQQFLEEDAKRSMENTVKNAAAELSKEGFQSVVLNGMEYLQVVYQGEKYGLHMMILWPMSVILEEISSMMKAGVMFGICVWFAALAVSFLLVGITLKPLKNLSSQMTQVGDGDFRRVRYISGSKEISELTDSFNEMIEHIERLIEQNYVAEINEKTLRLTALEAQLNPHFLYNTLQAIGTEALLNDQPQINKMLTCLASNMRYSIKGGDLVSLKAEMTYVKNYILLQKIRLEDRLEVTLEIEEELENFLIPKISIQTLVENSIIHGMGVDSDSIAVVIKVWKEEEMIWISVADDGCGIDPVQLSQMQSSFKDYLKPGEVGKIGIANLYSRLQILYQGKAKLEISSVLGKGTTIVLKIPVE